MRCKKDSQELGVRSGDGSATGDSGSETLLGITSSSSCAVRCIVPACRSLALEPASDPMIPLNSTLPTLV